MYKSGWGWVLWFVLAYGLLLAVPRVDAALTWIRSPGGEYQAYDPATGYTIGSGPYGEAGTLVADATVGSQGDWVLQDTLANLDVESSVGELALSGISVAADFSPAGVLALGAEVLPKLAAIAGTVQGLAALSQLLAPASTVTLTCTPSSLCGSSPVNTSTLAVPGGACSGETMLGYYYGANAQTGVTETIGAVCDNEAANSGSGEVYCIGNEGTTWSNAFTCPSGIGVSSSGSSSGTTSGSTTAEPLNVIEGQWADLTPSSSDFPAASSDLHQLMADNPSVAQGLSVPSGATQDSYSGPSSFSFPSVTTTTGGQSSTVTPTAQPTYSPGGVIPNVSTQTCTGTGSCSTTSSPTTPAVPFVGPALKFPSNPVLSPTNIPLSLNPQTVSGSCPPPVPLDLSEFDMGDYSISLQPLCNLASDVSPVIVASAGLVAGFIIFR